MSISNHHRSNSDGKHRRLFPFWQSSTNNLQFQGNNNNENGVVSTGRSSNKLSSVAKSLLPARRRLRLDPANNLYFPCELFVRIISCCCLMMMITVVIRVLT
ncbi:hypothetical protein HanHA300_Chr11g0391691 [Helianthus annuus]|nr:hypothetical protein HanHA300_Chr11g0391691 [Helianthus annuus]KAJ0688464.1 hypothetical protein HanOQP8_Chr11g0394591 [Helianthus annuus]